MKKVFLTLTMLLLAFLGTVKAVNREVEVGTASTTNTYIPTYTYYNYSVSQQIFTPEELQYAGTINAISFDVASGAQTRNLNVFMKHVTRSSFSGATDWEAMAENDKVFAGNISFAAGWVTVTLNTPFEYNGTDNLLLCVQDVTGSWASSVSFRVYAATNGALRVYRDASTYDVSNMSGGAMINFKNHMKVSMEVELGPAAMVVTPNPVDLGARPNGAWMKPATFTLTNDGGDGTVTAFDVNNNFFAVNTQVPFVLPFGESKEIEIGTGTATAGAQNGQVMISFGDRNFTTVDVTAQAYDPTTPDVWEKAQEVTSFPYSGTAPATIYKNYDIPGAAADAKDAVYKVTVAEDAMLNVTVGNSGVSAIYNQDFNNVGGPDMENVYTYEGPEIGEGPVNAWVYYEFAGNMVNYGSSSGNGWAYGYMIPASYLQENGMGECAITAVEAYAAATSSSPSTFYQLFILQGGNEPDIENLVYVQDAEYTPGSYFTVNLEEPLFLGAEENIWVMFITDSNRMVCGRDPEDPNGKIWYTRDLETWMNSTDYTPIIYTHFMEFNRGRDFAVNANLKLRELNGSAVGEMDAIDATVNGVSIAQKHLAAKGNRANTPVEGSFVPAGTYYVVAAATGAPFTVNIEAAEVPAPEPAVVINPEDAAFNVTAPLSIEWVLGNYTQEMQVLFGTQFPPTDILIDWTDELVENANVSTLLNNKTYFIQINERNAAGTTASEIYGFTTPIDPVVGFAVATDKLYPGDAAEFTWEANRSLEGYNLYMDGALVNDELITSTEYAVDSLDYNMTGYSFQISAKYGTGESLLSEPIVVKMTGFGNVSGTVYEQDETTVVPGVTVEYRGTDEHGASQSFTFTTDETGAYAGEVLAGTYQTYAYSDVYQETPGPEVTVAYGDNLTGIDIIVYENYFPLGQIRATEQTEENNVLVEWDWTPGEMIVDFETGDFSQADFTLPATYPWAITNTNAHEGTYCMKSTCEGIASGTSEIEVTVDVPFDAKMGFYVKTSTESNYDKFFFYIDGVAQGAALSGNNPYTYKEYALSAGTHTYKWSYQKDSSVNSGDDCVYVDDITMYRQDIPAPPVVGATDYNFDDGTMMGWTSLDANNDGYGWVLGSQIGGVYLVAGASLAGSGHNASNDMVCSGSFSNFTQSAITPDNYLVSPTKIAAEDGALINFWACAQDAGYAAEVFGVAVSTASNTNAADFTMVAGPWTMTAKRAATAEKAFRGDGKDQGAWYQYTADLSSYAGQEIWVAIRHYDCNDMFILNVDDITVATGGSKNIVRNDRSFQHFNLYRRDIKDGEETAEAVCIAQPAADVFEYTDEAWADLPYGAYQWGIQAFYEGNAPSKNRDVLFSDDFESGSLSNWTLIDNGYPSGEGWGYASPADYDIGNAHSGVGVAASWSWNSAAIDQDAYMISPLVEGATTVNYFVATNTSYPDFYEIMTSSTGVNSSDFTVVFSETAPASKGDNGQKVVKGHNNGNTRAMSAWVERTIDLPEGTKYVAFHHIDYDANYLFIDDVTISGGGDTPVIPTPTGDGLSEILWSNTIEKDMYSTVTVNVTLNNGQSPAGATVAFGDNTETMDETGTLVFEHVRKGEYELAVTMPEFADYNETVTINEDEQTINVTLMELVGPVADLYVSPTGWAMWSGATSGGSTPTPTPGAGQWYQYDDGTYATGVGLGGGQFYFGVMFPAGTYEGNTVTKVSKFDAVGQPMTGSVTIYNDNSTTAPTTAVGTANCTFTGVDDFVEVEFATPVTIDPSKNLWVIFDNASGDAYPAACSADVTGDPNGRWIGLSGQWMDMATAGVSGYTNMVRAYVSNGAKGEVHEISVPTKDYKMGTLKTSAAKSTRAALSFKVMLDGTYEGETRNGYFQHNVEGFEEGSVHTTSVAAIYATGMGDWTDYTWTYTSCENFAGATNVTAEQSGNVVNLAWEMPAGPGPGPTPPPTGEVTVTLNVPTDIWGDGSGYQMLLDETHSLYGSVIPTTGALSANCSGNEAIYAQFSHKIPENADGNCSTTNMVNSTAVSITIPAGTYDWCITNPTPGDRIWIAASNGNVGGRYDDYVFEAGNSYTFTVGMFGSNDGVDVTITGGAKNVQRSMGQDNSDCRVAENVVANRGNRAMWDFVNNFSGSSAGQQAVATDGTYIYTASWQETPTGGYTFYQYDLEGNFIEGFNIAGATGIRDLTTDGEYFYGSSGGAQIFCMDFTTRTLVSTINCSGLTSRHVSYDPERDGFWSGNWTTLALYSRTGALIQSGPAPTSAYGSAYYKDADDVEHLFLFCQTPGSSSPNRVEVYDYNIASNTLSSGPVRVLSDIPGYDATNGIAGGCFVGNYNGQTCFFANVQQDPNLIGIYELDGNGTGPVGPTGEFGILGAYVFRNGELISGVTPLTTTTFVDTDAPAGDNEYCVRVVYDGIPDTSYYAMSCPVCAETEYECIPVNNLVAEYTYNSADDYGVTLTWECEHADDVLYYNIYYSDTIVSGVTELEHYIEMTGNPGEYTYSVTAVYPNCESEPVYADVNVTSVNDINGKVVIYPNPTNSTVTIEAANMKHITVVNALGQVVYDTDLTADMTQLNLGQYKPGVYMVRINTEEGVSVKRVTVVK